MIMKFSLTIACTFASGAIAHNVTGRIFPRDGHYNLFDKSGKSKSGKSAKTKSGKAFDGKADKYAEPMPLAAEPMVEDSTVTKTGMGGMNTATTTIAGYDNSVRLLKREGIIDEIPKSLCEKYRGTDDAPAAQGKNVILVVGDGMGWEMIRAGAIAKQVMAELEGMGCDTKNGCPEMADTAKAAFSGRSLNDYYTEGKGSGLSFQELPDFHVMTATVPIIGDPNPGNHYGPANSFLGKTSEHDNGMADLLIGEDGNPLVFDPRDVMKGGNLVLWDDVKGGKYPWDENYYLMAQGEFPTDPSFDPEFILAHAIDSANSASCYATGVKTGVNQMGVDLYERPVRNILEEAQSCGKSGGIMTSVPILHATPGAFVTHTNYRKNEHHLQDGFKEVEPTWAMGTCADVYQPSEELKQSMIDGALSSKYTLLRQSEDVLAENFYDSIQDKDPNNGDKILSCFGGQYSSGDFDNMPYRGIDGTYTGRWCSEGYADKDEDDVTIGMIPNATICDHWPEEELKHVPVMREHVKEAMKFLGKDDDGFFLMYEQGDIDWAAHAGHLDDLIGAMIDIDEGVQEIIDWIDANGGYEKNALYVTADHDHYLTLLDHFPETIANMVIDGVSHNMTPENNSNTNAWEEAIEVGRHDDDSQSITDHLADFSTWTEEDIQNVAHFFGPPGSGGNGWGSHSTRPIVAYSAGDEGCLDSFVGKGLRILGREVEGSPDKIDQVHIHACMMKQLFGL